MITKNQPITCFSLIVIVVWFYKPSTEGRCKWRFKKNTSTRCRATKCDYEYRISGSSPSSAAPCGAKWLHRKEGGWIRMVWLPAMVWFSVIARAFYFCYGFLSLVWFLLLVWLSSFGIVLYLFIVLFVMGFSYWFGIVPLLWFCVLHFILHKFLKERREAALFVVILNISCTFLLQIEGC